MFENRGHWADKAFWWVAPIVVLVSAGGGLYYYYHSRHKGVEEAPVASAPAPVTRSEEPAIKHPVPQAATAPDERQPLPPMSDSDVPLATALGKVFDAATVQKVLLPDGLVRRIVVTVDNLPRQKLAVEKRPVKALEGQTTVETEGDLVSLSDTNYVRYRALVGLIGKMDTQQLGELYFHFYPLFQQAYEDLGYPGQYFNDRLVEAIDNLLASPEPAGRIQLVQPRVFYEFADPKLEERSAGQKLMIRMGRENATVIKGKLRELRKVVTTGRDPPSAGSDPRPGNLEPPRSGIISPPGGMHHWL
jgi:hypothetical protein